MQKSQFCKPIQSDEQKTKLQPKKKVKWKTFIEDWDYAPYSGKCDNQLIAMLVIFIHLFIFSMFFFSF